MTDKRVDKAVKKAERMREDSAQQADQIRRITYWTADRKIPKKKDDEYA